MTQLGQSQGFSERIQSQPAKKNEVRPTAECLADSCSKVPSAICGSKHSCYCGLRKTAHGLTVWPHSPAFSNPQAWMQTLRFHARSGRPRRQKQRLPSNLMMRCIFLLCPLDFFHFQARKCKNIDIGTTGMRKWAERSKRLLAGKVGVRCEDWRKRGQRKCGGDGTGETGQLIESREFESSRVREVER